jgi:uncharacterized protein YdeI (YjbR/CyaY-like superfamily)
VIVPDPPRNVGGARDTSDVDDDEQRSFATAEEFATWIECRGDTPAGVWMRIPKAGSGLEGIGYAEALQVALAHGWIDSQKRTGDEPGVWLQRFTPRRARSIWSKVNCEHAERLIAEGRMTPRGLAEVEKARADGRWDAAYSSQSRSEVPADLAAALHATPGAREFFDSLDSANRYAVLHRIATVKKAETRARKIEQYAAMLGNHEKLHP